MNLKQARKIAQTIVEDAIWARNYLDQEDLKNAFIELDKNQSKTGDVGDKKLSQILWEFN